MTMTDEHPNLARLRAMRDAWLAGDVAGFLDGCADDVVARVGGRSAISGTYRGKQEYLGYLGRLTDIGRDNRVEFHDLLAGDGHAAMVVRAVATRADGARLDMKIAFAVRLDGDGRWREVTYLPSDQAAWDDFFSVPTPA